MDPVTFEVASGVTMIDTFMGGRERYTAVYLLARTSRPWWKPGPASVAPVTRALDHLGVGTR